MRCEQRDIDRYKRIVAVCRLGDRETAFIAARDSFYMATTGETGWPYVQHRGGPPGFLSVLDGQTLAFPDFRGNRQFISAGNLLHDDRVSVFLMDYANRARLKLFGRASVSDAPAVLEKLALPDYRARIERAFVIRLEAFDWNCSQHITPRYTDAEVETLVAPLQARIGELEAQLAAANLRPGPGEYPA
ncbi:MAG: pyridoxamine 5'-phosphate oxidase family protein [Proteobacteria bacterium]|nr:pyridoxamine 5'-phosphate oxidase family protein [Pseudomonadota bacterium]